MTAWLLWVAAMDPLGPPPGAVSRQAVLEPSTHAQAADWVSPLADDAGEAARGASGFGLWCTPCHGVSGRGDGPVAAHMGGAPDLLGPAACAMSPGSLFATIALGGPRMPGLTEGTTPAERWEIVAMVRQMQEEGCAAPVPIGDDPCAILGFFEATCTSCHAPGALLGGLDLKTDPVAALVGVASPTYGSVRVVAGDPDGSLLIRKLRGTQSPQEGVQMPLGGTLEAEQIEAVVAWVAAGAPECEQRP
jgi:mono/diheme cytochrome c family protein